MSALSPLVSILMPVYNAEPFLKECLDSILAQRWKNWELLAVDDHSTDQSLTLLKQFAHQDARIQVLVNPQKGIQSALRHAFSYSRGLYLSRMDADDRMQEKKLAALLHHLQSLGPGHVSVGQVAYFSEEALGEGYRKYADWLNRLVATNDWKRNLYRECVLPSPCWMCGRQDLAKSGAFEGERYPEDYDLCFRMVSAGLTFKGISEVLHHWRDHTNRSSRTQAVYLDNSFFSLKVDWFLRLDRNYNHPLVLWGAGKRGKAVARLLINHGVPFYWITDNPAKQGHRIYDVLIRSADSLDFLASAQIILVVSRAEEQRDILAYLQERMFDMNQLFMFR